MSAQLKRVEAGVAEIAPARQATSKGDGSTTEGSDELGFYELTQLGLAQRFVRDHSQDAGYADEWGWMVFDGRVWVQDDHAAQRLMNATARGLYHEAADEPDDKRRKDIIDFARKCQQASQIQGALWFARALLNVRTDLFDQEDFIFNVANGAIDLRTGEFGPHRREHYLTMASRVEYDPQADCPVLKRTLEIVLPEPETRHFHHKAWGYSATGSTKEQCLFVPYGIGSNGKSTVVSTMGKVLGDYAVPARQETISASRSNGIPNEIAGWAGRRVATFSETIEGGRINEPLVKDLTGGDRSAARFLCREFFYFVAKFKAWMPGNHKPQIRGTDDGIWRRIMLIPFTVQIPDEQKDRDLSAKLEAELPGVLNWIVAGCLAWQREGLNPPPAVRAAVDAYRSEMDVLGAFFDECCLIGPGSTASAKDLFGAYCDWCEDSGERALSQRRFGQALTERGFEKTKPKGYVYHGIGLRREWL